MRPEDIIWQCEPPDGAVFLGRSLVYDPDLRRGERPYLSRFPKRVSGLGQVREWGEVEITPLWETIWAHEIYQLPTGEKWGRREKLERRVDTYEEAKQVEW